MRGILEIVELINSKDHRNTTMRDVSGIIEFLSSQYGATVRLAAKYKIQLMIRPM